MPSKILVVDDDASVRRVVHRRLAAKGYAVVMSDNGSDALLLARDVRPDLILLDVEMPGLDGFAVCRLLKKDPELQRTPVILMSGKLMEESDFLKGYDGGVDDYLAKPLSLPLLSARIHAVLARTHSVPPEPTKQNLGGIKLDAAGRTVKVHGVGVSLTRKEFDLLTALVGQPGRALSVPYLLETVWGYDRDVYKDPRTVEVHVSHLRKKLGPTTAKHIVNVLGHGYKFQG